MEYNIFLENKAQFSADTGFDPVFMPDYLFDFQKFLVEWSVRKGRDAIFADCGLGKTPMQLVWAENIIRKENKPVLIVTPLGVSHQTIREGEKFGIECAHSRDGKVTGKIVVTNYEKLHLFNPNDFIGVVCDESSILKNFDGKRKAIITEFLRTRPYRLLCTATAAPNDYTELGTSSEALGYMGFIDMLNRFFKNDQSTTDYKKRFARGSWEAPKWRFKRHAENHFWRWLCSWSRSLRYPSDMGFDDDKFILPPLKIEETTVSCDRPFEGKFFVMPAQNLREQRKERRITIEARCEEAAKKVKGTFPAVIWCHLNAEADLLEKIIPDALQVSGSHSDEKKEERFLAFQDGQLRCLITKPRIGGFGLNWQHCSNMVIFPSHSFEQYYQSIRRCWRFGQEKSVKVDIITTEGEVKVLRNLQRKEKEASNMYTKLVGMANEALSISTDKEFNLEEEVPIWL